MLPALLGAADGRAGYGRDVRAPRGCFPQWVVSAWKDLTGKYLHCSAASGQFLKSFALLRGLPWDLLESLHVPTALSPSQSHAVALAGCIRRRPRSHLFHGAEFKERY